jgi:hypothetical protein
LGLQSQHFFGSKNPYKHGDEAQQLFLEDLVLYICKKYKPLSTFENIWLQILVFCQCAHVNFPFHSNLVEHVLLEMVLKTMDLHVLHSLETITTIFAHFDFWMSRGGVDLLH